MSSPDLRCIFCNSKYHTYRNCPIVHQRTAQKKVELHAKQDYTGQTPNVFVGHYGYPSVNVGLLNTETYEDHDDPLKWSRENYKIPKIVQLRTSMINARQGLNVKSPSTQQATSFSQRFLDLAQEVGRAQKHVDVEINLQKKPSFKTSFHQHAAPHGPNVGLKKALLQGNPKINHRVEKAASDTDLKAGEAVTTLFQKGIDEHTLTRAFSVGNFGLGRNRKLVPTRWSITAVDDTLGKQLIKEIKQFSEGDCQLYIGGHLGNNYLIAFFDDVWQYELFEQFVPQQHQKPADNIYVEHDYESYQSRKDYAHETAGGYYAARLAILEELKANKRQASVLAVRVITEEYTAPLGVWVVREAVRKTLSNRPLHFADRNLLLTYVKKYCQQHFNYDTERMFKKSKLVPNLNNQKKLHHF